VVEEAVADPSAMQYKQLDALYLAKMLWRHYWWLIDHIVITGKKWSVVSGLPEQADHYKVR
jgi:hypothetical protein